MFWILETGVQRPPPQRDCFLSFLSARPVFAARQLWATVVAARPFHFIVAEIYWCAQLQLQARAMGQNYILSPAREHPDQAPCRSHRASDTQPLHRRPFGGSH